MSKGPYTILNWDEGVEINDDFFRACSPDQYKKGMMLVLKTGDAVQNIAKKTGQSLIGVSFEPGLWRR